jgi:16S rRNA C967 or C1407 C5-methylase (RsmB/RsmF family)
MDPTSLINIEEKDLDKMVQEEMDELTEMSLFVKPEGQLVFQTFTFDRKTTADITKKFLSRNPLFELVNETTLLPRKENSIGGYYALFRRKKVEAK